MKADARQSVGAWPQAIGVSFGFVVLRFLLAPVRIRVLTGLLDPADYGVVTLVSMSATAMAFVFSLGGFEAWLRWLPGARDDAERAAQFRGVFMISSGFGCLAGLALVLDWIPARWFGDTGGSVSSWLLAIFFLMFLHVHQRIYFLLGTQQHTKARLTQLLWADLWFLLLLPAGNSFWTSSGVLWMWSGWILLTSLGTWSWVPLAASMRSGARAMVNYRLVLGGLPVLPLMMSEWVIRLSGQYLLLAFTDAATMALYALSLNIALVGMAAGVPLVDVMIAHINAQDRKKAGVVQHTVSPHAKVIFSRGCRILGALSLAVGLGLVFFPNAIVRLLAASAYHQAADYLPWAALLPLFMLMNLVMGRLALACGRARLAGVASLAGALGGFVASAGFYISFSIAGIFLGITLGLLVTFLVLAYGLGIARWLNLRELRPFRLLAGGLFLALCLAGVAVFIENGLAQLAVATVVVVLTAALFRWVELADVRWPDRSKSRHEECS